MEGYGKQLEKQAAGRDGQCQEVRLVTAHNTKGLEFRAVYILDANEDVTPYHKVVLGPDVEEERRMFCMTMIGTRGRFHTHHVKGRYRKKQTKSRFAEGTEG